MSSEEFTGISFAPLLLCQTLSRTGAIFSASREPDCALVCPYLTSMPRLASNKSNRWLKILAWSGGGLIVLAVAAIFIGQAWLNRYLRSPEFRDMLESKTGRNIRAQVEIAPIQFDGGQFFCETFRAQGTQDAAFSIAKVDDLRGEVSIPSIVALIFGERRFRIPKIEVQRLNL